MKPIYLALCLLLLAGSSVAQTGVAINTNGNAPHSSALLDVQSTDKGFLMPRMTQAQRLAVSGPTNGLMVFDTDAQRLFQYQGGSWRYFADNSFWSKSLVRKWVYNGTDSVGIGITAPTERLEVDGNIKTSGKIDADGVLQAGGLSSLGALYVSGTTLLTGAVTGNSSANFGGNINSNSSMSITDAAGIFNFKNGNTDKGFVQLSGDDLRIGTYSGNTQGSLVVRTNGANQLKINDAGLDLQNNGKVMRAATGTFDLLPVAYGLIEHNGSVLKGTGNFSVTNVSAGVYDIVLASGLSNPIVSLTGYNVNYVDPGSGYTIYVNKVDLWVSIISSTTIRVSAARDSNGSSGMINTRFSFLVYGDN